MKLTFDLDRSQEPGSGLANALEEDSLSPEKLSEIEDIVKGRKEEVRASTKVEPAESVETDPRLIKFREDHDRSRNPRLRAFAWAEIKARLLANEGFFLKAAGEMEQGGVLFGVDKYGQPLISDRGDYPIMHGMDYSDTRTRVHWKHTSNDIRGEEVLDKNGRAILNGYWMFGLDNDRRDQKGEEILQYERHTGRPFLKPPLESLPQEQRLSSWLEVGSQPGSRPDIIYYSPEENIAKIIVGYDAALSTRGVRRLLRLEKAD